MFSPGDVIRFESDVAGKTKFHVCVSLNGCFFFLNTPRKQFAGDFIFPCSEAPFLAATDSGNSVIACNMLIRMSDSDLKRCRASKRGSLSPELMRKLITHVENSIVLAAVDKDAALDGLGEFF